jgi:hypothetical protein
VERARELRDLPAGILVLSSMSSRKKRVACGIAAPCANIIRSPHHGDELRGNLRHSLVNVSVIMQKKSAQTQRSVWTLLGEFLTRS